MNITCAMTVVAITFAVTSFAQEPKLPDKAKAIQAIEHRIGGRFVQESLSKDMPTVQWEFLVGACHGLPVVVDVIAYSSVEQAKAASIAAFFQAESDYTWLIEKNNKLTGAEASVESVDQYLERRERQKLGH
jgi:hypothetical protein